MGPAARTAMSGTDLNRNFTSTSSIIHWSRREQGARRGPGLSNQRARVAKLLRRGSGGRPSPEYRLSSRDVGDETDTEGDQLEESRNPANKCQRDELKAARHICNRSSSAFPRNAAFQPCNRLRYLALCLPCNMFAPRYRERS